LVQPSFFENPMLRKCVEFDKRFRKKYYQLPTYHQTEDFFVSKAEKSGSSKEDLNEISETLEVIFAIKTDQYEEEWLSDNTKAWIVFKNMDTSIMDAIEFVQTSEVTTENVKQIVDKVKDIILTRNNLAFDFEEGLDFFEVASHYQSKADTFSCGYPFVDACLGGGYQTGSLIVILGASKSGKSIWLGNLAVKSMKLGYNTAFVSFEMKDKSVVKRMGANVLDVTMDEYNEFSRDKKKMKKAILKAREIDGMSMRIPGALHIKEFPTSSVGVPEVENYLLKLQETKDIKLKVVVVDYLSIMSNWRNPNTENTYTKVKQIAEDLRAMGQRNDWVVVSAQQLNRGGMSSNDIGMENTSESIGLVFTVDALFGILQDEQMRANGEYRLKAVAVRESDHLNDKKEFKIDYSHMRITEQKSGEVSNLTKEIFKTEDGNLSKKLY